MKSTYCTWRLNGDGAYDSSCQAEYVFIDAGPCDNGFNYCPFCGKHIKDVTV